MRQPPLHNRPDSDRVNAVGPTLRQVHQSGIGEAIWSDGQCVSSNVSKWIESASGVSLNGFT